METVLAAVLCTVSSSNFDNPRVLEVAALYVVSVSVHGTFTTNWPLELCCIPYVLLAVVVIPFAAVLCAVSDISFEPPIVVVVAASTLRTCPVDNDKPTPATSDFKRNPVLFSIALSVANWTAEPATLSPVVIWDNLLSAIEPANCALLIVPVNELVG